MEIKTVAIVGIGTLEFCQPLLFMLKYTISMKNLACTLQEFAINYA